METQSIQHYTLTQLLTEVKSHLHDKFRFNMYWVVAETTDVKFKAETCRYFLKLVERKQGKPLSQVDAVVWGDCYPAIQNFESKTGKSFLSNLQVLLKVRVDYHVQYGLKLVIERIDHAFTLGQLEQEKQAILDALVKKNPATIKLINENYITANKRLERPIAIKNIAVISASGADGLRDFKSGLNKGKFKLSLTEYLTTIQGATADKSIVSELEKIRLDAKKFELVVIVRGGGTPTDLAPFNSYELGKCIAEFPIPVYTGIGHDRHTTISDLMANWQLNAPSDLAATIVATNKEYADRIQDLRRRIIDAASTSLEELKENLDDLKERFSDGANDTIDSARTDILNFRNQIRLLDPKNILARGFALVYAEGKIITNPKLLKQGQKITTLLQNKSVTSTINEITEQ
jgi:exodeoxyribonuclease VII large subunit